MKMKLIYRIGYYMMGFAVGLVFLSFILNGKKTSCNYGPNDRVISNISKKNWQSVGHASSEFLSFDSIAFQSFLKMASVDFGKSAIDKDSCKTYYLTGYWEDKNINVELENCEKTINIIQLSNNFSE